MHKHTDQQNAYAIVKKMVQAGDCEGMIEAISEDTSASSPQSLIDELSRWFVHIRSTLRTGAPQNKISTSAMVEALAEIARKKGIPASRFYQSLLEKILIEEAEETIPVPSKLSAKERILDAALEVFSNKGFHSATTDEIAERAGVGKGTVYRYFETKDKLFAELVRLRTEELERRAGSVIDSRDDVLTMISKYIRLYFEFFDSNQRLFRLIVQEQLDLGEHSPDEYFRRVMRAIPKLKRKVYEGTQQGVLKDVDFQTVFYGTMGFAHGVIQKWLARDCSYSLVNELPGVLEVLFYGFVKDARKIGCEN